MSSEETRRDRFFKLQKKRNPLAKEVLERKGPYTEKVINPKKSEYKRVKLNPKDVLYSFEDEGEKKESEVPMTTQRWRALLDSYSLTEILEEFDIEEEEVLERLFVAGLIDEEILKNLEPVDVEYD